MAKFKHVKVTFENNDYIETSINGQMSDEQIKDYYAIGKTFNIGNVDDNLQKVVSCEIIPENELTYLI